MPEFANKVGSEKLRPRIMKTEIFPAELPLGVVLQYSAANGVDAIKKVSGYAVEYVLQRLM